jgi:hypothetical protein
MGSLLTLPFSLIPPVDKRVKVSLFLQEGIQSSSGRLVLPSPIDASVGTVTTYTASGSVGTQVKIKLKSQQVRVSCCCQLYLIYT